VTVDELKASDRWRSASQEERGRLLSSAAFPAFNRLCEIESWEADLEGGAVCERCRRDLREGEWLTDSWYRLVVCASCCTAGERAELDQHQAALARLKSAAIREAGPREAERMGWLERPG
jgi:hypothetical protein